MRKTTKLQVTLLMNKLAACSVKAVLALVADLYSVYYHNDFVILIDLQILQHNKMHVENCNPDERK